MATLTEPGRDAADAAARPEEQEPAFADALQRALDWRGDSRDQAGG